MREADSLLSVSFACKHVCVFKARAGRTTDIKEECEAGGGWGCFGSVNFCRTVSAKGHGQNPSPARKPKHLHRLQHMCTHNTQETAGWVK